MKKSEVKATFYEIILAEFLAEGFSKNRSSDIFTRVCEDRMDSFQLKWLDANQGYIVSPEAGVRFEIVENIFHETSGFDPKYQAGTNTVGASLGAIWGGGASDCVFHIKSESDVVSAANAIISVFKKIALPYYEEWSTLKAVDAALNDDPEKPVRHLRGGVSFFRCSTGVIVAKLTHRENFEDLASFYMDVVSRDNKGFYLKYFQPLVDSLRRSV